MARKTPKTPAKKTTKRAAAPVKSKTKAKKRTSSRKAPKAAPERSLVKSLMKWCVVVGIWGVMFVILLLGWYGAELPAITEQADFERRSTITIKAADGSIISRYGDLKGNTISLQDVPPHLPHAVIAIEDRRFYTHFGIDPIGLARAMTRNILSGGVRQGGSTITQQLAKNLFLSQERTLKRKIQEAMLALWLEHELSKDEILSAYLNRVYLGSGAYGMDAAARRYFDKPASQVNLYEAAVLAGLLKAPSHYSPIYAPKASNKRARIVLQAMVRAGFVTQQQAANAKNVMVTAEDTRPLSQNRARYFTDWVISALDDLIGRSNDDLVIETTLHPDIQQIAEDRLVAMIDNYHDMKQVSQGAVLIMDKKGAIIAMVGGKDYSASQFNRTAQAKRQPGSAFKPIVYLTALEKGWDRDQMILDAPFDEDAQYRPENFNQKYFGEVTLTQALTKSMNTASVRLMQESGGPKATIATARKLGIHAPLAPDLSLALGSSAVSLIELSSAYAAIANGGNVVTPYTITRITGLDDILYYNRPSPPEGKQVIRGKNARAMQEILRNVVAQGTGRLAGITDARIAGKTGTSQDYRDAWFIGFGDDLIAGIWMGNDDNAPMDHVTGGSLPAILWKDIMQDTMPLYRDADFKANPTGGSFGRLLQSLLPIQPEIKRPDYNLNE